MRQFSSPVPVCATNRFLATLQFFFTVLLMNAAAPRHLPAAPHPYLDPSLSPEVRAADLVSRMTIMEKISQLGTVSPSIPRLGIAGYQYQNEALHGVVAGGVTVFPQVIGISATWDDSLVYAMAGAIADEARVLHRTAGKGLVYFSPTVNMARDPRWGRNQESYGEDPFLAGRLAVQFIRGMQGDDPLRLKTAATVKHFACNNVENGRVSLSAAVDERSLREYYLPVFKAAVREGHVASVMGAYNAINGIPCCASGGLLQTILRKEWGFTGFAVSDCDAIAFICKYHHYVASYTDAAIIGCKAGCDLCCGTTYQQYLPLALITNPGTIATPVIDSAVGHVLSVRIRLGEFDPPGSVAYDTIPSAALADPAKQALALQAARESIVLLKNNGLLPLDRDSVRSIAVIGPNAAVCRFGIYSGTPVVSVTPLQGISSKAGGATVTYCEGCTISGNRDAMAFARAANAARAADAVIMCMGTDDDYVGEDRDMSTLNLPGAQEALIDTVCSVNPRTVVVLINGNPLAIGGVETRAAAIVEAWYGGQAAGTAIAEALFGDYNPGGKLTATWVPSEKDLPSMNDYAIALKRTYRYFSGAPLYPFGYGLSYSTFTISNFTLSAAALAPSDTLAVTFTVRNETARTGDEVAQLYAEYLSGNAETGGKRLKGFKRVSLAARGSQTVSLKVPARELSCWNTATHAETVRSGEWRFWVGSSSASLADSAAITVTGGESLFRTAGKTTIVPAASLVRSAYRIVFEGAGSHRAVIMRPDGRLIRTITAQKAVVYLWKPPAPGLYLIKTTSPSSTRLIRVFAEK